MANAKVTFKELFTAYNYTSFKRKSKGFRYGSIPWNRLAKAYVFSYIWL